jgi:hypothetical protein
MAKADPEVRPMAASAHQINRVSPLREHYGFWPNGRSVTSEQPRVVVRFCENWRPEPTYCSVRDIGRESCQTLPEMIGKNLPVKKIQATG